MNLHVGEPSSRNETLEERALDASRRFQEYGVLYVVRHPEQHAH